MRPENIEDLYPLSPLQEGLLFHTLQAPGVGLYVVQLTCTLRGALEVETFARACQVVVDRHPVLRTAFVWEGLDEPLQVVCREVEVPLVQHDWRHLDGETQRRRFREHLEADRRRGFEPTAAPLMRLALVRLADDRHRLLWSYHHLILDGWSFVRVVDEVLRAYEAVRDGGTHDPPRPRPYRDYIAWLRRRDPEAAAAYWRRTLQGFSAPTPLGLPPAGKRTGGGMNEMRVRAEVLAGLRAFARERRLTLNVLLQGAWAVLLSRLSGEEDVVFGVILAGRPATLDGVERMIGLFINTLPLRLRVDPAAHLHDWLPALQAAQVELLEHEYTPLRRVQGWSDVPRTVPLFESLLDFVNYPLEPSHAGGAEGLEISEVDFAERPSYPCAWIVRAGEDLSLKVLYDAARLDTTSVLRLQRQMARLLAAIPETPGCRLGELPWLSREEAFQVLVEWNDTAGASPSDSIQARIEVHARRHPEAVAVEFGGRAFTYGEVDRWANRFAHHLRGLGVGTGALVGVYLERCWQMIPVLLGVLKAGAAYVPLDPVYPALRVQWIVSTLRLRWLVSQGELLQRHGDPLAEAASLEHLLLLDAAGAGTDARVWREADWQAQPPAPPATRSGPQDVAYVIFTSGSTGTPKGVVERHREVLNLIDWVNATFGVGQDDRILFITSLCFDLSVYDIFGVLAAGGVVRVASAAEIRDPERLVKALREEPITFWDSAPAALLQLTPFFPDAAAGSRLRLVFLSGDWIPVPLPDRVRRSFPSAQVVGLGGATEATVWSNFFRIGLVDPAWASIPYGRPISNARYYVLDAALAPCPIGVAGDLYIAGGCLAVGYQGQPALTADRFLPDPFGREPGARVYRTGDRARYGPDGLLEFLGRVDDQVKIRGFRIELGEIEAALRAHPGVSEAVATARQDGHGGKRLVAYVVSGRPPGPAADELQRFLASRLPNYMVPTAFVSLASLPVTANGKLDRRALPAPEPVTATAAVAPRTSTEQLLAAIWAEILGVASPGVDDNFFQLGGDSILSIQIVSRARAAGVYLTAGQVFEHQTIAALAAAAAPQPSPAPAAPALGPAPLTPVQYWFFEQDLPHIQHFNQSLLLESAAPLRAELLATAVRLLVIHHDALRLRFERDGTDWRQRVVETDDAVPFTVLDLSALPAAAQAAAVPASCAALKARGLDLARGPLFRAALLHLGAGRTDRLLLTAHHLAVDGVSWRILLEDLASAYAQLERRQAPTLPPKTSPFRLWAERLAEHAAAAALRQELPYWTSLPTAAAAPLPVDFPEASNLAGTVAVESVGLTATETHALLQKVPPVYHTQIQDVLLTALAQALAGWAGTEGALVDLEMHGREEDLLAPLDLSRTVGWFTSIFPVWLRPCGEDPGASLKAVKECLRSVPRRGLGYGLLRYLGDGANAAALQVHGGAQVSFNYLGQLDQALPSHVDLRPSGEDGGPDRDPRQPRRYLLEISAGIHDGRLQSFWTYGAAMHRRQTIAAVAARFAAALRALIAHCQAADAGGRTPSDFPLAALDQAAIDRLVGAGREVEDVYPLTPLQQGILFHTLRQPDAGLYFQQLRCTLEGGLDSRLLEIAWQRVAAHHPILRTAFAWEDLHEPLQLVHRHAPMPFQSFDWSELEPAAVGTALDAWLTSDRERGFDLATPPLMRLCLIRLTERRHLLVWSYHHLLLDGWSIPLLSRDVFVTYAALQQGSEPEVERRRPFREYIAWLRAQDAAPLEAFWRSYLSGVRAPTPLGIGARRETVGRGFGQVERRLPADATAALQALTRRHQLTLNTVVQGAWALLLSRYCSQEDVVFGAVTSGRPAELDAVDRMVGVFINTLPVRVRTPSPSELLDWLARLQVDQIELRRHEASSLRLVQEWSGLPAGTPLFESIVVFENYPLGEQLLGDAAGLRIVRVELEERTNYPLALIAVPGDELSLHLVFQHGAFDRLPVERALRHLENLLTRMATNPAVCLEDLSPLDAAERHALIHSWNDTRAPLSPRCLHELFTAQAHRTPDNLAVEGPEGRLTYRDLNRRSNQLAHHLTARGVGPESLVAVAIERSVELVVALLGVLKAGAAYVPIDPSHPSERVTSILQEVQAGTARPVVLTQERLLAQLPLAPVHARGGRVLPLDSGWREIAAEPEEDPQVWVDPDHPAYTIYTSGSTGRPKGAVNTHRGIVNRLLCMQEALGLRADEAVVQKTPFGFDVSVWEFFWPLLVGARLVVARPGGHQDAHYLARLLVERGVTTAHFVPSMLEVFLDEPEAQRCKALARVICSGEALAPALVRRFYDLLGGPPAGPELHNLYGPTESAVEVSWWPCTPEDGERVVPIGRPIANIELYVVGRRLELLPPGVPGELLIAGEGLARGYLGRPDLTAASFLPDPFGPRPGGRVYLTGDLARHLPDGSLEFLGRLDDQVKIRGFRVELGEIEAALGTVAGVRDAAVAVCQNEAGQPRLVGYVVPQDGELNARTLREALARTLPDYMLPAVFVFLTALPLNANGKLDRRALPPPDGSRPELAAFVAPRTPLEEEVARIWAELLGIDHVGVNDDFFELGGDSLIAMRLASKLCRVCGVEVPLASIFAQPTVSALAETIDRRQIEQLGATDDATLGRLLAEVEELADDEARLLLADEHDLPGTQPELAGG